MPYLKDINPSSGADRYAGVKILNVFADLRLELEQRELCSYDETDPLYLAINRLEGLLCERLADDKYVYPGNGIDRCTHREGE